MKNQYHYKLNDYYLTQPFVTFGCDIEYINDSFVDNSEEYKPSLRLSEIYKMRIQDKNTILKRDMEEYLDRYKKILKEEVFDEEIIYASCINRKKYARFLQNDIIAELEKCIYDKSKSRKRRKKYIKPEYKTKNIQEDYVKIHQGVVGKLPQDVLEKSWCILYNVKYNTMTILIAKNGMKLDIKGKTIINYDEEKSISKKVRWKLFGNKDVGGINSWIDFINKNVKTGNLKIVSRISKDILILKAL